MVENISDTLINDLAKIYDIKLVRVDEVPSKFRGPIAHGCEPTTRRLFIDETRIDDYSVEVLLHELVHIIVQPPFWSIKATPEEFILFQFERRLARKWCDQYGYEVVVGWQMETYTNVEYKEEEVPKGVRIEALALGEIDGYENKEWWRRGFGYCRRLGLLDKNNNPTNKLPNWSSFSNTEIKQLETYYRSRRIPYPVD